MRYIQTTNNKKQLYWLQTISRPAYFLHKIQHLTLRIIKQNKRYWRAWSIITIDYLCLKTIHIFGCNSIVICPGLEQLRKLFLYSKYLVPSSQFVNSSQIPISSSLTLPRHWLIFCDKTLLTAYWCLSAHWHPCHCQLYCSAPGTVCQPWCCLLTADSSSCPCPLSGGAGPWCSLCASPPQTEVSLALPGPYSWREDWTEWGQVMTQDNNIIFV